MLYPLKFKPIYKEKIWGGKKLSAFLNKKGITSDKCGESWEISAIDKNISVVSNGFLKKNNLLELIEVYMGDLVGDKIFDIYGINFPLLIKFIDAKDKLSLQVHPDDYLAEKRHNSFGKTEMWYVLDADPGSEIITGFNRELTKDEYNSYYNSGKITEILNYEKAEANNAFFIPAGRIHAIGSNILIAEIQQSSDITYRIHDWNRKDSNGKPRKLNTELAIDAI
ncbi:type I phosphomannose isomerase catalytic subunit, partial [Bacteroidota bacterium]